MGLKMPIAYFDVEKRIITVDEAIQKGINNELYCSDKRCRIPLSIVGTFKRKDVVVSSFFRRKGGNNHKDMCEYNTFGQLTVIARDSEGAILSINNNKFSLRLNLISSAIKKCATNSSVTNTSNANNVAQPSKNYKSNGEISAYLSTIRSILQIKSKVESENELRNLIEIKSNNSVIKWTDFYFASNEHEKCFNKLMSNKIYYPVCLEGQIKSFEEPNDKFPFYTIKLGIQTLKQNKDGTKVFLAVSIIIFNESLYKNLKNDFENGKNKIAFCTTLKANKVKSNNEFLNIIGNIYNNKQIHIF